MESLARRHSPPNRVRYPADGPFASVKQFTGLFHLSTPLRSDAVTFCFGVMACPGTDLHHAVYAPSRAHDSRFRRNDVPVLNLTALRADHHTNRGVAWQCREP